MEDKTTKFKVGQKVRVEIDPSDELAKSVMIYNGKVTEVAEVRTRRIKSTSKKTCYSIYTLRGCESAHGIPFVFVPEWLREV